jgi:hypothetical protein
MKWLKKLKPSDDAIRELILVAGFFMLGYGLWRIYQPAAYIVCGTLLLWLGLPPRRKGGD